MTDTRNPADRLDSWKEIAAYLRRDIRTVQRWEENEGLPVHRHQHHKLGSIYAYRQELTQWFNARHGPGGKSGKIKVAVLTFSSLGGGREDDYFGEGLAEEMITAITCLGASDLAVIARTTASHFDSSRESLDRMKKELGVRYVLEGKVRRAGNRVRITAQLVQLKDQTQLWAETYERDMGDVLTIQAEIAQAIARKINLALKTSTPPSRVEPAAYDAYLKARYSMQRMTPPAIEQSITDFETAIRIDPAYAPAYAGLASAYALLAIAPFDLLAPHDAMPRAAEAARRSLKLDDSLAEAHTALALVHHHYDWKWAEAESAYQRAIDLNPSHPGAHLWYSWLLLALGRRREAFEQIEQTMRIVQETDPRRLVAVHATRAVALYFGREFPEAVAECQRALRFDPGYFMLHYVLGRSYMRMGAHEKAIAHLESAKAEGLGMPLMDATLGLAYAVTGRMDQAREQAEKFKAAAGKRYIPPTYLGMVYAGLGRKDEAMVWLEKAFQERADGLTWLNVEPMLDDLRPDPRFQDLLHRIGLT